MFFVAGNFTPWSQPLSSHRCSDVAMSMSTAPFHCDVSAKWNKMAEESEVTFDVQAQLDLPQVPSGTRKIVIFHRLKMGNFLHGHNQSARG